MKENPYQAPSLPADPSGFDRRRLLAKVFRMARIPLCAIMFFVGMVVATMTLRLLSLHAMGIFEAAALFGGGIVASSLTTWSFGKLADRIDPLVGQKPDLPDK